MWSRSSRGISPITRLGLTVFFAIVLLAVGVFAQSGDESFKSVYGLSESGENVEPSSTGDKTLDPVETSDPASPSELSDLVEETDEDDAPVFESEPSVGSSRDGIITPKVVSDPVPEPDIKGTKEDATDSRNPMITFARNGDEKSEKYVSYGE